MAEAQTEADTLGRKIDGGVEMLWKPYSRTTRSGAIFAAWTSAIDFACLVSEAVTEEGEEQEDRRTEDAQEWPPPDPLNQIDEQWPPPDPWDEVDDSRDAPPLPEPPLSRTRPTPTYDDLVAHRQAPGYARYPAAVQHQVGPAEPEPLPSFDTSTLPCARGAYVAKVESKDEKYGGKQQRNLTNLMGLGFQLIRWNGRDARPLLDSKGRVFLVLAGQPTDNGYPEAVSRAYDAIKKEGMRADFPPDMRNHRRGLFAAMSVGLILGQGRRFRPGSTTETAPTWRRGCSPTSTLHGWPTTLAVVAFFALGAALYSYYVNYNARLTSRFSHLKRPFLKSRILLRWLQLRAARMHIQAPRPGGHLVLWDLRLVVEFPPGALILLPSATIAHSNIPVADDEERISFTQFTAGGLFRFVDNGFRTQAELAAQDPVEYARMVERNESRWEEGLQLFSTISELVETK
ncbi:hypothetical protein K438DRAFT_1972511 [Mycena galopus ATCC 62051]|nr:hypothetical protein K438DRAFT_1972511 [Mycena galopus ATCC 62051]